MEALVHAMLSNALVATILALPPLVLARFGRSPALVHSLWLVVLLKLVTPPLVTIPLPDFARVRQVSDPDPVAQYGETMAGVQLNSSSTSMAEGMTGSVSGITADEWEASDSELIGPTEPSEPRRAEPRAEHGREPLDRQIVLYWHALFLLSVVIGGLVFWLLAAVRIIGFQRLLRDIRPAPDELQKQLDAVADRLNLRRAPSIWLVPGQLPPMLWALGSRARLLVPSEFWLVLKPDQQLALLAHELAHLKRKDHWVRWLDLVVAGLYWWHPVLWWARSGLRDAEEQCCDAWAVWASPGGPRTYATALLAALEFVSDAPTAGVAAAAAVVSGRRHVSCLKRRMSMIVRARTSKGLSWTGLAAVLGLSVLILPLAPTWAQKPGNLSFDTPSNLLAAIAISADAAPVSRLADLQAQEPSEPRADRSDGASRQQEAADRLQKRLKELGDKLVKDLGPLGEEVRRALENAASEVSDTLKKEDLSGDDIRDALDRARDQVRKAFETGGPVEKEAREAFEKARRDMRESVESAHRELRETMLSRKEAAEKESLRDEPSKEEPGEVQSPAEDLAKARSEVRKMEQELRRAMRRLEALERREGRGTHREQRQNPNATPAGPEAPPRPPAPPRAPAPARARVAPRPPAPPVPPEAPDTRPEPAPSPDAAPSPSPAPRQPRRPGPGYGPGGFSRPPGYGPGGRVGPGADALPGPPGPGGPVANPRVERRLRDLESKLDRLLKEIEGLKGEKNDKATDKEEEDDEVRAPITPNTVDPAREPKIST